MASPFYTTGTASVSNGSTAVTGAATNWSTAGLRGGDLFGNGVSWVPIASVNSNTSITLARAWTPTAMAAENYWIWSPSDADRNIDAVRNFMQNLVPNLLAEGQLTGAADKIAYFTGVGTKAVTDFKAAGRSLAGAADMAAARALLGAVAKAGDTMTGGLVTPGIYSQKLTIADDAVGDFGNVAPSSGVVFMWPDSYPTSRMNSFYAVRTSSSPVLISLFGLNAGIINTVTTDVGGTTGADNAITVSVTSGHLKVENRTGNAAGINIVVFKSL